MIGAIFPGQGSQHAGMGKFLFDNFPTVKTLFEEASDAISVDIKKLCFDGPDSDLALTHNTQPALLLVSVATFKALQGTKEFQVTASAGHSVGEYAALVCADTLPLAPAIQAVRLRGEFMQSAVPVGKGGMLAVMGLTPEQVQTFCNWAVKESGEGPLEPANFNAPGQIVVSGNMKTIEFAKDNHTADIYDEAPRKVRLIPLKVSAPFHCSMMKPAQENMNKVLNDIQFSAPNFPVVQNVSANHSDSPDEIRKLLIEQISAPVRWVECTQKLVAMGATQQIEFGCGKVLSGLTKKIDSDNIKAFNINSLEDFKTVEASL